MIDKIELTKYTKFSGCGAKLGPGTLDKALCGLSQPDYPNLIADFKTSEDAGIYRINDDIALIQTLDFFPPIVNDPFTFGQITAANALSDIYAMGAKPITAMSIVAFPKDKLDMKYLQQTMEGGMDKLIEAETALVGGHSLEDDEMKFGFAITGLLHPDKVLRNNTLKPGETLILTKPLGTGAINTALRAEMVSDEAINTAIKSMITLNKRAAEIIKDYPVSACTDITGFGLIGHACEMMANTKTGIHFNLPSIKIFPDAMNYLSMGLIPAGTYRNKEYRIKFIRDADKLSTETLDIMFDPQTSGGLFFSVPHKFSAEIMDRLKDTGLEPSIAGETTGNKEIIEISE